MATACASIKVLSMKMELLAYSKTDSSFQPPMTQLSTNKNQTDGRTDTQHNPVTHLIPIVDSGAYNRPTPPPGWMS